MQINFDSNQAFGAIRPDNVAKGIIARRANSPKKYIMAEDVIGSMYKSKVNATVHQHYKNRTRLVAFITDLKGKEHFFEESRLSSIFCSPVKFLNKIKNIMIKMEKEG